MGKLRQDDSDNEMDIEPNQVNNRMETQTGNKVPKKNKKIAKSKLPSNNQSKSKHTQSSTSKDVVKQYAKLVNLKKSQRPLTQKQQIFKRVVKGLHGQNLSKQQRRKSRILLKKELQKALQKQEKHEPKAAFSTMQSEKSVVIKKKKQPMNEKAEVIKMRSAMGQSLSSLKSMLAQKLN